MQKYVLPIIVAVLAFVAVGLGYLIFQQFSLAGPEGVKQKESAPLSSEAERVLQTPGPDATDEERQAHLELAQSQAQRVPYLDITSCPVMTPLVLEVTLGEQMQVRNDDSVDHELVFGPEDRYAISAQSTQDLDIDFQYGSGLYGYSCDHTPYATGLFLVVP